MISVIFNVLSYVLCVTDFVPRFTRDLKRCKWLDDMTLRLAFQKDAPHKKQFGASKAEVVTALCSMMHSPLSKQYPIAFAR